MKIEQNLPRRSNWSFGAVIMSAFLVSITVNAAERIALVIGTNDYISAPALGNAVADSRLIAKVLEETGFEVIALENPGIDEFYEGLEKLKRLSGLAKVGVVYFAGHGVEVEGQNYLLPVDAELTKSAQLRSQAMALETILDDLADVRLPAKVVILDCCRDNPLSRSWMASRSMGRGLAAVKDDDMPEASLVVYSAGPGQVALDGVDGNSPFTKALAIQLREPGQNLFQAFLKTSDDVVKATQRQQEPWVKMDGAGRAIRELVLIPADSVPSGSTGLANGYPIETSPPKMPAPQPTIQTTTTPVGNGATQAYTPNQRNAVMKESAPVAYRDATPPQVGNSPEPVEMPTPLVLPSRGYFSNDEVFRNGPYASYNDYTRTKVLRSAQGKLTGSGSPDGKMGGNTQTAIQTYQAANSLAVTGCLDTPTLTSLGLTGMPEETYTKPTYTKSRSSTYSSGSTSKPAPVAAPPAKKKSSFYKPPSNDPDKMTHAKKKFMRPGT